MDQNATDTPVSRRGFMTAATGAAATAAGAAGTASAQEGTEGGESGGGGGGGTKEVIVGPGGEFVFDPDDLTIANGTTVNFVWESDNHNVVVDSQPEEAGWEGTEGGSGQTYDTGYEYSHTFDTNGEYEYFCSPHVGVGMEASITVQDSVETEAAADTGPVLPESAKTLGVATVAAMLSVLSLAYFFMRFGGDFETPE